MCRKKESKKEEEEILFFPYSSIFISHSPQALVAFSKVESYLLEIFLQRSKKEKEKE